MADNEEKLDILSQFPGQREKEEIAFTLRKHPITLIPVALTLVFMALLPFAFYVFFAPYVLRGLLYRPYSNIFFLLTAIYCGFIWIFAFMEWLDYYLDILIITNKRIMNVKQMGLFHRVVSELELERIQDITSFVDGPVQTFFDFGSLEIQTASEENKIEPKDIPHPVRVRRKIMELCEALDENK